MQILSYGKYKCPYCGTIVELDKNDIEEWNNIIYYECPTCDNTPHIKGGNFICPHDIQGKKAIKVN